MSATEFIEGLKAMPAEERERVFATLAENPEWREDILDLITLSERRDQPARPLDEVLKDLNIEA
ncbi:MAG TPA: hypothetical protein VH170_04635 [Chthoniobacterales bacterium]|jgi:hypothetical protein|nr:hypothetical protein [Chthoniobacterales bacterium]